MMQSDSATSESKICTRVHQPQLRKAVRMHKICIICLGIVILYQNIPRTTFQFKKQPFLSNFSVTEAFQCFSSEAENLEPQTEIPALSKCPIVPPGLRGRFKVNDTILSEEKIVVELSRYLEPGGFGKPTECVARERVAIIIPYRDRKDHLRVLLANLHPLLRRQQIDYGIFVVEQVDEKPFNRAKLFNVGYNESIKLKNFTCFIFHDVDLVPEDDRSIYTCSEQPRHMSVAVDKFKYRLPFPELFGGVVALTRKQFEKVNGFSNSFWGWGGEDNDMAMRIKFHKMYVLRHSEDICHYKMLSHKDNKKNPERFGLLKRANSRYKTDGINSLIYEIKEIEMKPLYTWILAQL